MKSLRLPIFAALLAVVLALSACSSQDINVVPVPLSAKLEAIYIIDGGTQWPMELQPALVGKLSEMGFVPVLVNSAAEVPEGEAALTCAIRFTKRNVATVEYLRIDIRRGGRLLGYATSDASGGLPAFGTVAEHVNPLLEQLLMFAKPVSKTPTGSK